MLSIVFMIACVNAENVTYDYYCPPLAFTNENFTIWFDYQNSTGGDLNTSNVSVYDFDTLDNFTLEYTLSQSHYSDTFYSATPLEWNISLNVLDDVYDNISINCTVHIKDGFNFSVSLWEEVNEVIVASTTGKVITEENYNKILEDPYINDFAYLLAVNKDYNSTHIYDTCYLPLPGAQAMFDVAFIPDLLHNDTSTDSLAELKSSFSDELDCNLFWFRAKYNAGLATIKLPIAGNYSLYLADSTMEWENAFSPPHIIKPGILVWLGDLNIPEENSRVDFWISHDELDFWTNLSDVVFFISITLLPIFIFFVLSLIGVPASFAGTIALGWSVIWTTVKLLF